MEAAASKVAPAGPQQVDIKTFDFPVGTKYIASNILFHVIRRRFDSNTEWRTVISATHGDQDYMVETLRRDIKNDPTFVVVELGDPTVKGTHG